MGKSIKPNNNQSSESSRTQHHSESTEEIILFTTLQKGDLKIPTEKQLHQYKVPETDLIVNENAINLTSKLSGATASDITISLNQDTLTILGKNKKIAYYTEIKLSDHIIPQSAVAKFENGILYINALKLNGTSPPWEGIAQLQSLSTELKDIKERHAKFQQQYHTIQLDYQNLLIKSKKEVEEKIDAYKISVIEKLLKNIDNFERALESISKAKNKNNEQILVGINLILNELRNIITEEHVNEIASEGMLLDPHQHEVLDYEETDKYPENTILKVYQKGYRYKDRVLRPSKVRITISPKQKKKKKK